ncbi:MAG: hypothetical protein Q9P90_00480 [candidate division KSB1 bacterium]|nr:hypothetical protein [candidate division KSB1 bacterium]
MLGDSAHATTPNLDQGACQAIESAFALARLLHLEPTLEKALQVYYRLRKKRTVFTTQTSWQVG